MISMLCLAAVRCPPSLVCPPDHVSMTSIWTPRRSRLMGSSEAGLFMMVIKVVITDPGASCCIHGSYCSWVPALCRRGTTASPWALLNCDELRTEPIFTSVFCLWTCTRTFGQRVTQMLPICDSPISQFAEPDQLVHQLTSLVVYEWCLCTNRLSSLSLILSFLMIQLKRLIIKYCLVLTHVSIIFFPLVI